MKGEFEVFYQYRIKNRTIYLPDGYTSQWLILCGENEPKDEIKVTCKVQANNSTPLFSCIIDNTSFESFSPSSCTAQVIDHIKANNKRTWSGYQFFGFHRDNIISKLEIKSNDIAKFNEVQTDIKNLHARKGGPTSTLKYKQAIVSRHSKIDKVVEMASFGDTESYIEHLIQNFPDVVANIVCRNNSICSKIVNNNSISKTLNINQSSLLI